ncbi:MAG TPA: type II toxin-antitoxin system VapC family toxin [Candidatus Brocadiaceae bacterium]
MEHLVLDASVVLKWYFNDEAHGQKALDILSKYISNDINIVAPSLLEYEVVNGLIIAQKRGRIEDNKINIAIDGFYDLGIKLKNLAWCYQKVFSYCKTYHCSAYDASYLVIAEDEGITMVTSDERLYNQVKKDLKWVQWLGDVKI